MSLPDDRTGCANDLQVIEMDELIEEWLGSTVHSLGGVQALVGTGA